MTNLKIGISPLTWTNQSILELGDHISYEECITQAAMAGFNGVELGRKFPEDASSVLSTLSEKGLVPVTAWYSGRLGERSPEDEWSDAEPEIAHLIALGCKLMVYGECACGPVGGSSAFFRCHASAKLDRSGQLCGSGHPVCGSRDRGWSYAGLSPPCYDAGGDCRRD